MPLDDVESLSDCDMVDAPKAQDGGHEKIGFGDEVRLPKFGSSTWFLPQLKRDALSITLVPPKPKTGSRLPKKGTVLDKPITLHAFGTVRCFGATTKADTNFLSLRGSRDFSTQVFWWRDYGASCRTHGVKKGVYCKPETAEHFAGLPIRWTSAAPMVVKDDLFKIYPWMKETENPKAKRHPVLSLFSGVLGFELGIRPFVQCVGYVEKSSACQACIRQRIKDGLADKAPLYGDCATLKGSDCTFDIDGMVGGFPCQGTSRAGLGLGLSDPRSALVSEFWRIYDERKRMGRPMKFLLLENVSSILSIKQREVMQYLEEEAASKGLRLTWATVDGYQIGAHIWRERTLILIADPGFNFFEGHTR